MNEKNKEYKLTLEGIGFDDRFSRNVSEEKYLKIVGIAVGASPIDDNNINVDKENYKDSESKITIYPRDFLDKVEAKSWPEKILALAKCVMNDNGSNDFSKEEVPPYFQKAREKLPTNYNRDFSNLISSGWIAELFEDKSRFFITSTGESALIDKFSKGVRKSSRNINKNRRNKSPVTNKKNSKVTEKLGKKSSYKTKDINLGISGETNSIFDYVDRYQPKSNIARNAVFVHYYKEQHPDVNVDLDYIYTCYDNLGIQFPTDLYSSVMDTGRQSKRHKLLNLDNMNDIKLTIKGQNFIRELKSAAASKK